MQPFLLKKSLKIQRTLKELEVMYQNATYNVFLDNHECDKQVCDNHECLKSDLFSYLSCGRHRMCQLSGENGNLMGDLNFKERS